MQATAQDGVLIDYGTATRDNSAVLDVRSANQGILAPRVALTATNSALPVTSPATSLLVYNTATAGVAPNNVTPGYYYWDGGGWKRFMSGNTTPLSGSGAATRVAFWDGVNSLSSDADLYWDNTNKRLGVGTASPSAALTINNGNYTSMRLENDNPGEESAIRFRTRSSDNNHWFHADIAAISSANSANTGYLGFKVPHNNTAGSGYDMVINSDGNVGISTTSPVSKFEVEGGAANWNETTPGLAVGSIHLDPGTSSANIGNAITWGAHDAGAGDNGQAGIYVRSNGSYGTKMYFGTTNSYATGSQTRMMINDDGDVGIGTISPTRKLEVYGAANCYPARVGSPDGYLDFGPANASHSHFVTDRPTFYFNKEILVDQGLIGSYNQDLQLRTAGTTRITALNANGNVGIATASPGQKLEVNGNIKLDDNMMVEGNSSFRVYRNLASYSAGSGAAGAFVINTTHPWNSNCMFRLKVEGYFYDSSAPFEITIGGYMYINDNFINTGYVNTGAKQLSVRFARNTSTNTIAIILGNEGSSYSYPKLTITSYMQGHAHINEAYADGWAISQITSLSGYDYTHNVPNNTNIGQGASVYSSASELALASNNTGSYSNSAGAGWTAGTWQDVSGFSVARTITSGNMVQITADGLVEGDNYNYYVPSCIYFRLLRGSTEIARTAVYLTSANYVPSSFWYYNSNNFSMNVVETATSGSQTYKVQYWMPDEFSATEYVRIGSRRLNVVETNQ